MSADQSQAVVKLMALAYRHSQLYYDWHNDAVGYTLFEAVRDELRAAITTALREQYAAGIAASAGQAATLPDGMVLVPVDVLTRAEFVMRVEGWREDWQAGDGSKRADAYAAVLSQLAARDDDALPAGMVLVPVEPTPGMIDAARACQLTCEYAAIYRTMIAAREAEPS